MNKEYIEAQVVSLTRKIHPQDLGEETSKLENILRQALEDTVAEERERVRGVIEKQKKDDSQIKGDIIEDTKEVLNGYLIRGGNQALDNLLSSLDKLTDKDI